MHILKHIESFIRYLFYEKKTVKNTCSEYTYTNQKKKQCIAKMLITHKTCSRWAWKFIKMVSPIHTLNYQTFYAFCTCISWVISLSMKSTFYVLCYRKTTCNKIYWCKTQVYGAYDSKTTLLLLISAYRWRHTFLKISFCGKMQHAWELLSMLAIFDVSGLSKIVSAKLLEVSLSLK